MSYLHDGFKHGDEDELDESDLGSGLRDFVPVHEGRHWEALGLLPVALGDSGIWVKGSTTRLAVEWRDGHLHKVLLQQAVHPGLGHLGGPHFIGDVAALDQHHLQLE